MDRRWRTGARRAGEVLGADTRQPKSRPDPRTIPTVGQSRGTGLQKRQRHLPQPLGANAFRSFETARSRSRYPGRHRSICRGFRLRRRRFLFISGKPVCLNLSHQSAIPRAACSASVTASVWLTVGSASALCSSVIEYNNFVWRALNVCLMVLVSSTLKYITSTSSATPPPSSACNFLSKYESESFSPASVTWPLRD